MAKKYTKNADGHGWLKVRYADGGEYPPLPVYTLVETVPSRDGRVHFNILEGRSRGKRASLSNDNYLIDVKGPHGDAAKVYYERRFGELWYGDADRKKPGIPCRVYTDNPPPLGTHDLEIPDEVHPLGNSYLEKSDFATTWFRIGHRGDRYLHPGSVSLGCITVTDVEKWTSLYWYLVGRRKGDGKSVGTVQIFEV